jgi:hypothetical protein
MPSSKPSEPLKPEVAETPKPIVEAPKPVEPSKASEPPKPVEAGADETDDENLEAEQCFRAGVQVPEKKFKQLLAFDGTELDIYVNGNRLPVEIQIKDYEGRYDYDFEVCFWGTGHLNDEDRKEVHTQMRRWLVQNAKVHTFWHKGLEDIPKPKRQEVYMWFE